MLAFAGCKTSPAESPGDAGADAEVEGGVGPSPLRRWTNAQLANVLHDLFPSVSLELPALPRESSQSGFDNDVYSQAPSDVRVSRYEAIANQYAEALATDQGSLQSIAGCSWAPGDDSAGCARQFISRLGRLAFRRPLTVDELQRYEVRFQAWAKDVDFEGAAQLTIGTFLQSPQFLYLPETSLSLDGEAIAAPLDSFSMATRLAAFLWESTPDEPLLQAAELRGLIEPAAIRAQAERMLADEKAKRVMWSFTRQWLGIERIREDEHLVRTPEVDPAWTSTTPVSAEREVRLFVEDTLFRGGTIKDLLTSPTAWVDSDMARIYGVPATEGPTQWSKVTLPLDQRAGVLTRVAFLAGTSHRGATSPPIRGNAIQLRLLCKLPMPPPPNIDVTPPHPDPANAPRTNRDLFTERTSPPRCRGCHQSLNGIGFALEHYTASGSYQTSDHGLSIDASGELFDTDVDQVFSGGLDLSRALSESKELLRCAVLKWLSYTLGRVPTELEQPTLERLQRRFIASGGNVRQLLLDIVVEPTFRLRGNNQ